MEWSFSVVEVRESKERATKENKVGEKDQERKAGKMRLGIA